MYVKSFKEFINYILLVFKEKRFWYSVEYCILVFIERIRGIDFVKNEGYEKLHTSMEKSSVYQATRDTKYLKKVMKQFSITKKDSILDLGCGKGFIMKFFKNYDFGKIGGVELSELLCNIATQNFNKLQYKNCKVYHEDAMIFDNYDSYNYIYMFNPFPQIVMEKVMQHIYESLKKNKRKIVIIYKGPFCHSTIVNEEVFTLKSVMNGKTLPYHIYCNE